MNSIANPFRPSFGVPPLFWAGHTSVLEALRAGIIDGPGPSGRAIIISGTRGIGKTVLLNELQDLAKTQGWVTLPASGLSNIVENLVNTTIPKLIEELSPSPHTKIDSIGISTLEPIGLSHSEPTTFTPSLNTHLRELLKALSGTGILVSIDDVQDASPDDLTAIATTFQDLIRDEMGVALVATGLPTGINALLNLPGTTFLRRAQRFVLGPLSDNNAAQVFLETAHGSGIEFDPHAVTAAVLLSRGYPYMVQLIGSLAWIHAHRRSSTLITSQDVDTIASEARSTLSRQVHGPAAKSLTGAQRDYLDAMSRTLDSTTSTASTRDIARYRGCAPKSLSATRQRPIDTDVIEPAGHGAVRFVIPYIEDYFLHTDSLGRVD